MRRHLALILGVIGFTPAASRAVDLPFFSLEDALRSCEITEMTMSRVAPEPASCAAPVEPSSWGQVKAYYR